MNLPTRCDCLVLGGGPAGSTAAALVAGSGASTVLLERESMPRFHVGESLMPESYWVMERLGVLEKMQQSDFVKKYSVQFVTDTGKESTPFFFDQHDPRDCSQTWQVERSRFDKLLYDNAAEHGALCFDKTRVLKVHFQGERATGAQIQTADGKICDVESRVVMDATGQHSILANQLGLKRAIPELRKAAIWGYFQDAERVEGKHGGATLILHTETKDAWFWYIPLSGGITSVGLVGDVDFLLKSRPTPQDAYCEEIGNCPALARRIQGATMVSEHHVAKEFSYTTTQHAGEGWVLIGDAFGFIDPIYSSGVYFALKTGEMAADAVIDGLCTGDLSGEKLGVWTGEFTMGSNWVRKLVDAFYTRDFSFGRFMKAHPQHQGNVTDLLIGRVFHERAGRVFDDLDRELQAFS